MLGAKQNFIFHKPLSKKPESCTRKNPKRLATVLFAAVLAGAPVSVAQAAKAKAPPATPEIAEKQADLGELRSRIDSLSINITRRHPS